MPLDIIGAAVGDSIYYRLEKSELKIRIISGEHGADVRPPTAEDGVWRVPPVLDGVSRDFLDGWDLLGHIEQASWGQKLIVKQRKVTVENLNRPRSLVGR